MWNVSRALLWGRPRSSALCVQQIGHQHRDERRQVWPQASPPRQSYADLGETDFWPDGRSLIYVHRAPVPEIQSNIGCGRLTVVNFDLLSRAAALRFPRRSRRSDRRSASVLFSAAGSRPIVVVGKLRGAIPCRRLFATFAAGRRNSASEMTYIVSSGALNSTHSLTHWTPKCRV